MSVTATMACGHQITLADGSIAPQCPTCGEVRVSRVKAPAPRFRGMVLGPCAEFEALPAKAISLKETADGK
jgi:hypothetical protein